MSVTQVLRYNYRLRPGVAAVGVLDAEWHRSRWLWNQMVASRYDRSRRLVSGKDLTAARKKLDWLRVGSQNVQEQTLYTFRGKGKRAFKSKRDLASIGYSRNGFTISGFTIKNGRLNVKGASLPVVWHRDLASEPSSVRIYRDSLGHWYASFVVQRDEQAWPDADGSVGIDWGVSTIATGSEPEYDFEPPVFAGKASKELTKYQRRMARRKPAPGKTGSRGYRTAKQQTARLHKKVARQRQHTTRAWARRVVANNQVIAVEDFRTKFLFQSTMARKAGDNAVGQAKRELLSYAARAGRSVVIVPPAYTTMTCSSCFARNKQRLELSERIFACTSCGYTAGRDRNAARVILAQAERTLASAETVRHAVLPSGELQCAG